MKPLAIVFGALALGAAAFTGWVAGVAWLTEDEPVRLSDAIAGRVDKGARS
jgi:hypothetical protein